MLLPCGLPPEREDDWELPFACNLNHVEAIVLSKLSSNICPHICVFVLSMYGFYLEEPEQLLYARPMDRGLILLSLTYVYGLVNSVIIVRIGCFSLDLGVLSDLSLSFEAGVSNSPSKSIKGPFFFSFFQQEEDCSSTGKRVFFLLVPLSHKSERHDFETETWF